MVHKRQREARKKFKAEHPELFLKAEPTPPKDPNKKKKKKTNFKRKKKDDPNTPIKKGFKKHPLRIPGMKPGDSCFICKAKDHIAKLCPKKAQWEKHKICLLCRRHGHSLKNCPDKNDETVDKKLCYNCGEIGHSLSNCTKPLQDGGTKFASCFVCNETGHLSRNCPKNTHGIYPKGGSCKICGDVTHLAKHCPNQGGNRGSVSAGVSFNAFTKLEERPKVTKFFSGDDLEDDFMVGETLSGKKDKSTKPNVESASHPQENLTKSKKKQGPKVVNFVG